MMSEIILILYTTKYRKGGDKFKRVARTMKDELSSNGSEVISLSIESKAEIKEIFKTLASQNKSIKEFHFIGHSGMYGPMYGTVAYPEQFSPYELKKLVIPFAHNAKAYFHCCRSARWFAPYFSRVQNVTTFGYHWYTSFSSNKARYKLDVSKDPFKPLYCFGCPGKKSHGYLTSVKKYLGLVKAEPLKEFKPEQGEIDSTYNSVAELYNNVFQDIKVRSDEYKWIISHLPKNKDINVLDIGCGNGALLKELANKITSGTGVDISKNLIRFAKNNNVKHSNLQFEQLNGPELPFKDNTFDLVISMLSFRYLDWDPIMKEIQRVTNPEGKLLIIDMVTAPVKLTEYPQLLRSKLKHYIHRIRYKAFYKNLRKLVHNPNWKGMLKYNPIRSEHEMKWYIESRFPGRKVEVINIGYNARIIAFDTESMENIKNINLSYP
ncbi:class I SAM-dependent methyltransferase [Fulvivirga lutea]|uniref:Class I SAM-dependent methyltransferase n=1 Tax=Fulvivirga lutea TaxID=2810512 RepID=A0A974WL19_9BACT|nr:class I SAM-dependent methyltransferase [Fulvivirga lutea]QSE99182.1 class I SAM-dependent methyltransferase [Fulvivirga lutea]